MRMDKRLKQNKVTNKNHFSPNVGDMLPWAQVGSFFSSEDEKIDFIAVRGMLVFEQELYLYKVFYCLAT